MSFDYSVSIRNMQKLTIKTESRFGVFMTLLSLSLIFACLCITKSLLMSIRKEGLFEGQRYIIRINQKFSTVNLEWWPFLIILRYHSISLLKGPITKVKQQTNQILFFKECNFNIQFTGLKVYTALSRITNSTTGKYCSLSEIQ